MLDDVWKLVEESAKKNKRSSNNWLEIHLQGFFLSEKIKADKKDDSFDAQTFLLGTKGGIKK